MAVNDAGINGGEKIFVVRATAALLEVHGRQVLRIIDKTVNRPPTGAVALGVEIPRPESIVKRRRIGEAQRAEPVQQQPVLQQRVRATRPAQANNTKRREQPAIASRSNNTRRTRHLRRCS